MNLEEALKIVENYMDIHLIRRTLNLDKVKAKEEEFIQEAQKLLKENPDLLLPKRFQVGLSDLSEDMEDYIYEQNDYYQSHKAKFYTSFYETVCSMMGNGVDLSDKQLAIIEREYKMVKEKRIREYEQ